MASQAWGPGAALRAMKHRKTVLIVEDDVGFKKLIGVLLLRTGYEVKEAASGNEALDRARADHPDLIIMDLEIPDFSGADAIKHLKADPATNHIPIIVLTSSDRGSSLVKEATAAGASKILYKPASMKTIEAEIRRHLT